MHGRNIDGNVGYRILAGLVDWVRVVVILVAAAGSRSPLLLPRWVVGIRVGRVGGHVGRPVARVRGGRWCLVRPFCKAQVFQLLQHRVVACSHLLRELGCQGGKVGAGITILKAKAGLEILSAVVKT